MKELSSLAKYEYVARIDDGARDTKWNALVFHRPVSPATDLYDWWSTKAPAGVGAHFYINHDGDLFQYLGTSRQTGHAFDANPWSLGLEVEDGAKEPVVPMNEAQLVTAIALCQELDIPGQLLTEAASHGVGWHCQWPSWNKDHHTCPDAVRIAQVKDVIVPALLGGAGTEEDEDMMNDASFCKGYCEAWDAMKAGTLTPDAYLARNTDSSSFSTQKESMGKRQAALDFKALSRA